MSDTTQAPAGRAAGAVRIGEGDGDGEPDCGDGEPDWGLGEEDAGGGLPDPHKWMSCCAPSPK